MCSRMAQNDNTLCECVLRLLNTPKFPKITKTNSSNVFSGTISLETHLYDCVSEDLKKVICGFNDAQCYVPISICLVKLLPFQHKIEDCCLPMGVGLYLTGHYLVNFCLMIKFIISEILFNKS